MCKIAVLTSTKKIKNSKKMDLLYSINQAVCASERHGFGWYHASGFGEKTLNAQDYLSLYDQDSMINVIDLKSEVIGKKDLFTKDWSKLTNTSMLFHGRTSTNNVSLINTHPISKDGFNLIHNGVVTNNGPTYQMETTNDTEHLVHYLSQTNDSSLIEKHLSGYYAFASINPKGQLILCRDKIAPLYIAYVKTIESYFIATTSDIITEVCSDMNWSLKSQPIAIKDNLYMIYEENILKSYKSIKSLGYMTQYEVDMIDVSMSYQNNKPRLVMPQSFNDHTMVDEYAKLDVSIESYFEEIESVMDLSYKVYDLSGREVCQRDFFKADDNDKMMNFVVTRADGTIVDLSLIHI